MANLQPRCPNIGFSSCKSFILLLISCSEIFKLLATMEISFLLLGKNSCKGGSSRRTVTGSPLIVLNISIKSFFWNGRIFFKASFRSSTFLDKIICLTYKILSSSKNICSVLQRPIPSAPKSLATLVSNGVSALVLILRDLTLSAHAIRVEKSPEISGLIVFTSPSITSPVEPSSVTISPSFTS